MLSCLTIILKWTLFYYLLIIFYFVSMVSKRRIHVNTLLSSPLWRYRHNTVLLSIRCCLICVPIYVLPCCAFVAYIEIHKERFFALMYSEIFVHSKWNDSSDLCEIFMLYPLGYYNISAYISTQRNFMLFKSS